MSRNPPISVSLWIALAFALPALAAVGPGPAAAAEGKPLRKWEVHLIHQTHLDIGYTHTQEEVLQQQVRNLNTALDEIERTKDYPEEARFKWHPEGMWAIDEFLRTAPADRREAFLRAIRKGYINLDAFYAHVMTGLSSEDELIELMADAKRFARTHGFEITSAIGSDVPGYTWGLVTAMGQHGVKYFHMAPNNNHRLGYLYLLAEQPFYWESPCGKYRVLVWMSANSYINFWGKTQCTEEVLRKGIFDYLDKIAAKGYPYDVAAIRYCLGDNGAPVPSLPDAVKAWNEKHAWPKLILSTTKRAFQALQSRYGDKLPVRRGDMTPYWEDGAASTSADLALSRAAGERAIQAQTLWSLLTPSVPTGERFADLWREGLMYHEHTWGAHCSISQPLAPFTVSQEKYKQQFAVRARDKADAAMKEALSSRTKSSSRTIDVYNTCSWSRTGLIGLPAELSKAAGAVADEQGRAVPSQRLADGTLAWLAESVPALGARRYTIGPGGAKGSGVSFGQPARHVENPSAEKDSQPHRRGVAASGLALENDSVRLGIDPASGAIRSLVLKASGRELVDPARGGLNDYLVILGRDASKEHHRIQSPVTVTVEDAGPLVGTLRIESEAPGCNKLVRRVRMCAVGDEIELFNLVDKKRELRQEAVYFAFPLALPGAQTRIDIPFAVLRPETDQLPGANRNYYSVQRWVDVSDGRAGLTWATIDAPMIKFHPIQEIRPEPGCQSGRGCKNVWDTMYDHTPDDVHPCWVRTHAPTSTFYSMAMYNHWETNYKAFQEGPIAFRYVLLPHSGPWDAVGAQRFGRGACQPLLPVPADPAQPVLKPPLRLDNDRVIVTTMRPLGQGEGWMIRLLNLSDRAEKVRVLWEQGGDRAVYASDPGESRGQRLDGPIDLAVHGFVTLRADR